VLVVKSRIAKAVLTEREIVRRLSSYGARSVDLLRRPDELPLTAELILKLFGKVLFDGGSAPRYASLEPPSLS
jgi:hypothetical protein